MQQTTNYSLKKIELTDSPPDITVMNPNWDTIDTKLKENADGLASHLADDAIHVTQAKQDAWNAKETTTGAQSKANTAEKNAKDYTDTAPEAMQRNMNLFRKDKSGKDSNGVFTVVDYKRANNTLYAKSTLSGGTSPKYTTRTVIFYKADGATVERTDTWTLSYDAAGDLISEVKA